MSNGVTPEAVKDVLDALVGDTSANADTTMDDRSLENVSKLAAVADWLSDRLVAAQRHIESPYASAKQVAKAVMNAGGDLAWIFQVENGKWGCDICFLGERMDGKCPCCKQEVKSDD